MRNKKKNLCICNVCKLLLKLFKTPISNKQEWGHDLCPQWYHAELVNEPVSKSQEKSQPCFV